MLKEDVPTLMPIEHIVKQGEHLSGIADRYGFADYLSIWNYPENATLKQKRKNPHVLLPGDRIVVPDRDERIESCATGTRHRFRMQRGWLKLRLVVKDFDDLPVMDTDCELEIQGATYKLKTDCGGKIETEVPSTAENGILRIPELGIEMPVRIGHLDPGSEETGWQARLQNLGYNPGSIEPPNQEQLRSAIEEFQCDYDLPVTGELNAATKAKIEQVHGC